jgi:hypothetical protein
MFSLKIITTSLVLLCSSSLFAGNEMDKSKRNDSAVMITFENQKSVDEWRITNDGVMGGLSRGKVEINNQTLLFSGVISTENYGGFTSFFRRLPKLPSDIESINIQVTGDGHPYQLRFRCLVQGYYIAYKADFSTKKGVMVNHTLNFSDFEASFRGRIIDSAPKLEASFISDVGFLIASKKPLDFVLEIHQISLN